MAKQQPLKCFIVGAEGIGKSTLITKFLENKPFTTTPFRNQFWTEVIVDGYANPLELATVSKEYKLKLLPYEEINVFIVCFSLVDRSSFELVWAYCEMCKNYPSIPIVLVGTMSDKRKDTKTLGKYDPEEVGYGEGLLLAARIGAKMYLECSALTGSGVETVFDNAVRNALLAKQVLLLFVGNGRFQQNGLNK